MWVWLVTVTRLEAVHGGCRATLKPKQSGTSVTMSQYRPRQKWGHSGTLMFTGVRMFSRGEKMWEKSQVVLVL